MYMRRIIGRYADAKLSLLLALLLLCITTAFPTFKADAGPPESLEVQPGGFLFDRQANEFVQRVQIVNRSARSVKGPIFLLVDGLPPGLELRRARKTTPNQLSSQDLDEHPDALFVPVRLHGEIGIGQTVTEYLRFQKNDREHGGRGSSQAPAHQIRVLHAEE